MIQYIQDIRRHYEIITPKIFLTRPKRWVSPYGFISNWSDIMSPIEEKTWMAIRCYGKLPMYPQYPIGKYFADFANPVLGIVIECDGKDYHTDKKKDEERDRVLMNDYGYAVYRISGADCLRVPTNEFYNISGYDDINIKTNTMSDYYNNTIDGLLASLAFHRLFIMPYNSGVNEKSMMIDCLNKRVSLKEDIYHSLTNEHY